MSKGLHQNNNSDVTRSINSINEVWRIESTSPFLKHSDRTLFSGGQRATYLN
jgi:hypothetical protein